MSLEFRWNRCCCLIMISIRMINFAVHVRSSAGKSDRLQLYINLYEMIMKPPRGFFYFVPPPVSVAVHSSAYIGMSSDSLKRFDSIPSRLGKKGFHSIRCNSIIPATGNGYAERSHPIYAPEFSPCFSHEFTTCALCKT